jgi:hypothetical protein
MRSTFRVLFYTKNQSIKNGKVPVMGRITINKTTACFSCKKEVSISLWDAKANRAKGKSEEARMLNQELDNAKAQIAKHYQYICDHDSFVTAKKVYSRYVGFKEDSHTLMELFREQLESYKEKVGKEKAKRMLRTLHLMNLTKILLKTIIIGCWAHAARPVLQHSDVLIP